MKNIILIIFIIFYLNLSATIINVPADQPTIQEGIDVAIDSDTVLVQPDTYIENINYEGKNITVASLFLTTQDTIYISQTIINGNESGSVVIFEDEEDSTAVLCGFTITNGTATIGGGICCNNSSPSLENSTITSNSAWGGGGICCEYNSNPSLGNVTIENNSADYNGGGIYCVNSSPSLKNVTIANNSTDYLGGGGGIYCFWNSSPNLVNVTIANNSSNCGGGILCDNNSCPSFVNVIITGNSADYGSGILCGNNCNPSLVNCILWNYLPEEIYFWEYGVPNSITISYSDIQGGEAGIETNNNGSVNWLEGNIDDEPLFDGTGEHPYSLLEDSPCIDTGTPDTTGLYLPLWDIIGNLRIWDGDGDGITIIDMGAYEYGAPPYVDIDDNIIIHTSEVFLHQNYPNPFNPSTTFSFSTPEESKIELTVYNIKGQRVRSLANNIFIKGNHSVVWDRKDDSDHNISSGIYFYELNVNGKTKAVKKCLVLK